MIRLLEPLVKGHIAVIDFQYALAVQIRQAPFRQSHEDRLLDVFTPPQCAAAHTLACLDVIGESSLLRVGD